MFIRGESIGVGHAAVETRFGGLPVQPRVLILSPFSTPCIFWSDMLRPTLLLTVFMLAPALAAAQEPLTLSDVVARAKSASPSARAVAAAEREAGARIAQARSGLLPRADVSESWQRGNQPVFVFGSKLTQRRFAEADFAIDALNRPSAINNLRTAFLVTQPVFDGGAARGAIRAAELQHDLAGLAKARSEQDLAFAAVEAFAGILEWDAAHRAAVAAVETAESDLAHARNRRDLGVATDADVLAVEVHAADMRQRVATSDAERRIARERLNAAIGRDLSTPIELVLPASPATLPSTDDLEALALRERPEARQAVTGTALADAGVDVARAAFLPRVDAMGGWEVNGSSLANGASSWVGGVEVKVNLFNGFADRARLAEAEEARRRQHAEREAQELTVRLEVRAARARLDSARVREVAGQAAIDRAREAQRIVRDRYEQGLATISDVLRAAEALLQAESLASGARADLLRHTAALDRAVGRL